MMGIENEIPNRIKLDLEYEPRMNQSTFQQYNFKKMVEKYSTEDPTYS